MSNNKSILQNNNLELSSNNLDLQNLIDQANSLPDAGSIELPELMNEGTAADLLLGKELIKQDGSKVTGAMPNNSTISYTMDGINTKTVLIPKGYTDGGSISLDGTIDNEVDVQAVLIAQLTEVLSTKSAYNTIYIGSSQPTSNIGVNGDIYIVSVSQ